MDEVDRKGNFIWYHRWAYDEYELHHVGIGTLMTVDAAFVKEHVEHGDTLVDKLWHLVERMVFDYFARVDGVGQRCMIKQVFWV